MTTLHDFTAESLAGQPVDLAEFDGKVVLVVNTASECGFAPQLHGLQALYDELRDEGLVVLGFPSNQFAGQEPGSNAEIAEICERNYGVTFPMFAKIDVNGGDQHPLYRWLKSEKGGVLGDAIKWNFTKFLVGRDGDVIKRYAPTVEPKDLRDDIVAALAR